MVTDPMTRARVALDLLEGHAPRLQAYASRTGTKRNLRALREAGWHLLVSARGVLRTEGFPYALDNGAWTAFQKSEPFDENAYQTAVDMLGADAAWTVLPDIVAGGRESLTYSLSWLNWTLKRCPRVLLAVQDGMTADDVAHLVGPRIGIAIGGSTEWKEQTMARRTFTRIARDTGAHLHALRVNTARRIRMAHFAGCNSIDGSSVSRFACNLPRLDKAVRQESLPW